MKINHIFLVLVIILMAFTLACNGNRNNIESGKASNDSLEFTYLRINPKKFKDNSEWRGNRKI